MADHGANRAVVHPVVSIRVEERRLQNAGRKHNLVHVRVVIRVHGRRRHAPIGAIDRLADLLQIAVGFKLSGTHCVQHVRAAVDLQQRIIEPFVGIADLDVHRGKFLERFFFCGLVHPIERFDSIGQGFLQIVYQLERARLGFRRKIKTDVQFPERFADLVILGRDHPLPTRFYLLRAAEGPVIEIEPFVDEILGQVWPGRVNQMPAQVRLPIVNRRRFR